MVLYEKLLVDEIVGKFYVTNLMHSGITKIVQYSHTFHQPKSQIKKNHIIFVLLVNIRLYARCVCCMDVVNFQKKSHAMGSSHDC